MGNYFVEQAFGELPFSIVQTIMNTTTQQYVDLAFVLVSTNSLYTPAIDFVTIVYQDNSYYEMASVGATSAGNTDFGVRRIDPTTTVVKKLNDVAGKVFITRTIN